MASGRIGIILTDQDPCISISSKLIDNINKKKSDDIYLELKQQRMRIDALRARIRNLTNHLLLPRFCSQNKIVKKHVKYRTLMRAADKLLIRLCTVVQILNYEGKKNLNLQN